MKFEPVPQSRFTTELIDGSEWLVARTRKNWIVLPFLTFWIALWSMGGVAAISQLFSGDAADKSFIALWLCGWALGWVFAAGTIAWQIGGRQMISVTNGALIYRWVMPLLSRSRNFDVRQVRLLRQSLQSFPWSLWGMSTYPPFMPGVPGAVRFDYGGRTVQIMQGLDEAEGRAIADWLAARLPASARGEPTVS